MKILNFLTCLCLLALLAGSCRNAKPTMTQSPENRPLDFTNGPPTIVYKTKYDYSDKAAVMLNADKTEIVAYPHPRDIAKRGQQVYPTPLVQGFLLDNQGINVRAAFTRYTFAEYAALAKAPTLAELKANIIDKDPFVQLCNCGNRNQFAVIKADLDKLINQKLTPCHTLSAASKTE